MTPEIDVRAAKKAAIDYLIIMRLPNTYLNSKQPTYFLRIVTASTISTSSSNVSIVNERIFSTSGRPFLKSIVTLKASFTKVNYQVAQVA